MDHDSLNIKHKTIKLLYQNTGENLGDHGFGDESRYNPKAQFIEEKIFAKHLPERGLVSKIHKRPLKFHQKTKKLIKIQAKM